MPEFVGLVEDKNQLISDGSLFVSGTFRYPRLALKKTGANLEHLCQTAVEPLGAMSYCGDMRGFWILVVCASAINCGLTAQEAPAPAAPLKAKSTTIIGCLAGPDADDLYTLTSMQHRTGVEVVGSDELKKGAGAKVKLTGSWEALPGSDAKKSDATRRFKATEVDILEEKCQAPAAVTPQSKKKQQQEQQKAQAQQQQK